MHRTKHTLESLQEVITKYDNNLELVQSELFPYKNDKSTILVRLKEENELKTDTLFNIRNRFYARNRRDRKKELDNEC